MTTTVEATQERQAGVAGSVREFYDRSFPLEGIKILSRAEGHGDGRTVEAYAAIFDTPQEIRDQHGHYNEDIHRTAFNRTLRGGAQKALCLYNHGMSVVDGRPDSLAQVPLGSPLEIRADARGLLTVTRYNKSALADSVLEAIKNDDLRAQSFRGPVYKSNPTRIPRAKPGEPLPTVTRMELGLRDYGPTPAPAYDGASIIAVRSAQALFSDIAGLDEIERAELFRMMLAATHSGDPVAATATPTVGSGSEDSRDAHSGRSKLLRLKADALFHGV